LLAKILSAGILNSRYYKCPSMLASSIYPMAA